MRPVLALALVAVLSSVLNFSGCMWSCGTKQNPEELRQKTAETTANLKQDAKAVAQGIREGLTRDHKVNINRATQKELTTLPGINTQVADRIIARRPYNNPDQLVTKRAITQQQYEKIANQIAVEPR